jgi:hypothetical protein
MQPLYSVTVPAFMLVLALETVPTLPLFTPHTPSASGIVAGDDGSVYFVDAFHNTVWRVAPGGGASAFVTGLSGRSLRIDGAGNIYGTHQESSGTLVLWRADPAGDISELARTSFPAEHAHSFVLVDTTEVIGWIGHGRRSALRLWRRRPHTPDLIADPGWALRAATAGLRFSAIGGIAQDARGNLIVATGASILKLCRDGSSAIIASDQPLLRPRQNLLTRLFGETHDHLTGIAIAGSGDIYVANRARNVVVRIDGTGRMSEVHASEAGWTPTGVAIGRGVVYVLEYGNGVRVQRITADGSSIVALVRSNRPFAQVPAAARFAI